MFHLARAAFGLLPAAIGLTVLLLVPTLFLWSISLLKESMYLLGTALVLSGAVVALRAATWWHRARGAAMLLAGLLAIRDLRPGSIELAALGLACGLAMRWATASARRFASVTVAAVVMVAIVLFVTGRSSAGNGRT